jgi:hypothetical protein
MIEEQISHDVSACQVIGKVLHRSAAEAQAESSVQSDQCHE